MFTRFQPHCLTTLIYSVLFTGCVLFSGCSALSDKEKAQRTEEQYFAAAQTALTANNYSVAVEQLEQLESQFPFGRYAEQTQLDLMFAYYKNLDFESAVLQAERFIQQYPDHVDVDYAYYMKGLARYSTDRGFLARLLPTEPSERELLPIKQSFADFSQLINKFPQSAYSPDARQRMIYLRNLLADHEIKVAQYYMKRKAYISALNRCHWVIREYPQSPSMETAFIIATQAYVSLNQTTQAQHTLAVLVKNFPQSRALNANGEFIYTPDADENERSLLNVVSFGLVGRAQTTESTHILSTQP
jgi:outer membrane protein assembly factor BamD